MKQKAIKDMNFKGKDIDSVLEVLWSIKNEDKFYFKEYGKAYIEELIKNNVVLDGVSVSFNSIETMLMRAVINAPIYKDGLGVLQYDRFKPMLDKEWELLKRKHSR